MANYNANGRPVQYNERIANTIALPKEARDKVDKMRGDIPLSKYLCRIICEHVGVSEENYNLNRMKKRRVGGINARRD